VLHHPQTGLEALCHVDRRAVGVAVDVRVNPIPAPKVVTLLQSVILEPQVLQLALIDLVLFKSVPRHISARDSRQRPSQVADRECDPLLLFVKSDIVRPQSFLCKPGLNQTQRTFLVQTKDLLG